MSAHMIYCRGRCKQRKAAVMFRPSDLRRARPICRACRNAKSRFNVKQPSGAAWRQISRRIFAKAIVEGRAA